MNYSDFHKNRVPYNINTTNKAKSTNYIIYYSLYTSLIKYGIIIMK